jgi:hypothetical protein
LFLLLQRIFFLSCCKNKKLLCDFGIFFSILLNDLRKDNTCTAVI